MPTRMYQSEPDETPSVNAYIENMEDRPNIQKLVDLRYSNQPYYIQSTTSPYTTTIIDTNDIMDSTSRSILDQAINNLVERDLANQARSIADEVEECETEECEENNNEESIIESVPSSENYYGEKILEKIKYSFSEKNNKNNKFYCEICGKNIVKKYSFLICDNCLNKYFKQCMHCGNYEDKNDFAHVNERDLCFNCLKRMEFYKCHNCGNFYSGSQVASVKNDYCYCKNCLKKMDNVFRCDSCRNYYTKDRYGENGNCINCTNSQLEDVNNYSYKPSPRFYHKRDEHEDLYLGVELEMGCVKDACTVNEFASEYSNNVFYMKRDTSIPIYGCEIVTQPLTLSKHLDNEYWSVLLNAALKYGFNAEHEKCGIHIHISRNPIDNYDISKLDCFVNTYDFWKKIARRESHYSVYVNKNENVWGMQTTNRRCALNLSNNHTIEFRIFKGTLNYNYLMAYLEFCYASVKFIQTISMEEVLKDKIKVINKFKQFIKNGKFLFADKYAKEFQIFE